MFSQSVKLPCIWPKLFLSSATVLFAFLFVSLHTCKFENINFDINSQASFYFLLFYIITKYVFILFSPLRSNSNQNTALNALQLQQQQQLLEQQLLVLANSPFGDSPLFRNSLVVSVPAFFLLYYSIFSLLYL